MEPGRTDVASIIERVLLAADRTTVAVICILTVLMDGLDMSVSGLVVADMASGLHIPITVFLPVSSPELVGASALPRRTAAAGITNRPNSRSNGRGLHPSLDAAEK